MVCMAVIDKQILVAFNRSRTAYKLNASDRHIHQNANVKAIAAR